MMAFFPLKPPKDAKEYEPGSKTDPKPSTSSESESDFPSLDLSLEEAQPKKNTKPEHGQCPYIESSRRCSSDTGQKLHKKGLRKKIVNIFFRKGSPPRTEKDSPKQESQPLTADQIRDMIKDQQFFEACQHLLVMRKTSGGDSGSKCEGEKTGDGQEVPALFEFLKEEVLKVIHSSVTIAPVQLELLQDAVRTVTELVEKGMSSSGEEEASEFTKMKEDWRRTIQASVQERMKEPSFVGIEGISTTAHSFLHMGKTMKEDLITVVQHIKPLYPEHFQVCRTYAKFYHECFSYQAQTIAQFGLDDKDTYLLLNWTLNFYPKNIINHEVLKKELDKAGLENLLPPHQIRQHETAYLTSEVDSIKRWLTKCLDFEVKRWSQEKEPEKLHGYFHSELSIDAIQSISGGQQRAEKITPELGQQASRLFLVEFHAFLQSYKKKLEIFIKENKKHHYFQEIIIANINNCLSFRTYTEENTELAKNSMKGNIFSILGEIQNIGFDVLLQDLFQDLQPLFRRFTQNKWVSCGNVINEIIAAASHHVSTFKALKRPLYQAIMEKIHLQLIQEYILRLVKKKVSLRTPEQQNNLSELVQGNASMLCTFCAENAIALLYQCKKRFGNLGSCALCEHAIHMLVQTMADPQGSNATWLDDVLPSLAAIIRLQDKDAIMVAVGGLVNNYPDISEKHLSAILYIKGNLSSSDKRSILSVLDIGVCATLPTTQLFSTIKVS